MIRRRRLRAPRPDEREHPAADVGEAIARAVPKVVRAVDGLVQRNPAVGPVAKAVSAAAADIIEEILSPRPTREKRILEARKRPDGSYEA